MAMGATNSGEWVLEDFKYNNLSYLLDRATGYIYAEAHENMWPELVGRLENGQVTFRQHADIMQLFAALDAKLKNERVHFSDLFRRFDTNGNGQLDIEELSQVVNVRTRHDNCMLCCMLPRSLWLGCHRF